MKEQDKFFCQSKPFLKRVAEYGEKIDPPPAVVLPTQRSKRYLLKEWKKGYPPQVLTLLEFGETLSTLTIEPPLQLTPFLFEIFRAIAPSSLEFFKKDPIRFLPVGESLIRDFDEIDKALIPAKKVFFTLKEWEEIRKKDQEEISSPLFRYFHGEERIPSYLSPRILRDLWEILPDLYEKFKEKILSERISYEGMVFRILAEMEKEEFQMRIQMAFPEGVLFAGIDPQERAVLALWERMKTMETLKTLFLWDLPSFPYNYESYLLPESQKRAHFSFSYLKNRFPSPEDFPLPSDRKRTIYIHFSPHIHGIFPLLSSHFGTTLKNEEKSLPVGIVTPLSQLLPEIVTTLPEGTPFNIAMGIRLDHTPLKSLLTISEEILNTLIEETGEPIEERWIPYPLYLSVLSHPYLSPFYSESSLCSSWEETGLVPILTTLFTPQSPFTAFRNAYERIPQHKKTRSSLFHPILSYLKGILEGRTTKNPSGETNYLDDLLLLYIQEVENWISRWERWEEEEEMEIENPWELFHLLLTYLTYPLEGEPLQGVQIMGILETRALSFSTIFLFPFIEREIPTISREYTFLPPSIREMVGLPGERDHQIVQHYYFYRLLSSTEEIHLFVPERDLSGKEVEPSRFLWQISEMQEDRSITLITTYPSSPPLPKIKEGEDPVTMYLKSLPKEDLKRKIPESLSPSSLIEYLECPRKFYFSQIENLSPPLMDPLEKSREKMFGTLFHHLIGELYKEIFSGKETLTAKELKEKIEKKKKEVHQREVFSRWIQEKLFSYLLPYGPLSSTPLWKIHPILYLQEPTLIEFMERTLERDLNWIKEVEGEDFLSLKTEHSIYTSLSKLNLPPFPPSLKGRVDRMIAGEKTIFVLDYKTGKCPEELEKGKDPARIFHEIANGDLTGIKKNKIFSPFFQIVTYAFLLHAEEGKEVTTDLYYLSAKEPSTFGTFPKNLTFSTPLFEDWKKIVTTVLERMFQVEDTPFPTNPDREVCKICPYLHLCKDGKLQTGS